MGFLDNSGDIILDAVLTDAGRQRLARGDGTFRITQFALGDDEINYALYNKNTGSAYQDLDILQTPVLEAFTNNIASLNSKLITIPRTDLLYLPVIKLLAGSTFTGYSDLNGSVVITTDAPTETAFDAQFPAGSTNGFIKGFGIGGSDVIELHQGLDTTELSADLTIDPDLKETQYIVEIDNRFGTLISPNSVSNSSVVEAVKSFVDDDDIAQYYFALGTDNAFVGEAPATNTTISGPRGTRLRFLIRASQDLSSTTSTNLFDTLGSQITVTANSLTHTYRSIKTTVIISGATTGRSVTVPLTFIKKV